MKRTVILALSLLAVPLLAALAEAPARYDVLVVEAGKAEVSGDPAGLSVGADLYYARSPFKFTITAIRGNVITVALPERHELRPKQTLYRAPTDAMKKSMKLEAKLKHALED